jgi:hypothetical protein
MGHTAPLTIFGETKETSFTPAGVSDAGPPGRAHGS